MTKNAVRIRRRAERLFSGTIHSAMMSSPPAGAQSTEAPEKAHEPASARREQGRRIIAPRGPLARLAARRVGHDQIGERADLELLRNRQRPREDQIAGPGAEDRGSENAAIPPQHDLDQPFGAPFGLAAVVFHDRPSHPPPISPA